MNANELKSALSQGKYEITHHEECNCPGMWSVEGQDLVYEVGNDVDWCANVLVVDGVDIAERIQDGETHILCEGINYDDIPDAIWDELKLPEDSMPAEHYTRRREALVAWLMQGNYDLDRDDERGFGNEYTVILRPVDTPVTITHERAERWADDYLYKGDAATQSYVSLSIQD